VDKGGAIAAAERDVQNGGREGAPAGSHAAQILCLPLLIGRQAPVYRCCG